MLALVTRICEEQGRDPSSLGKSIGVFVEMTDEAIVEALGLGVPLRGDPRAIAEAVHEFAQMGVDMLELLPVPFNDESMERLTELVALYRCFAMYSQKALQWDHMRVHVTGY